MSPKPKLIWDDWNVKHINKHHLTQTEVEEAYKNSHLSISTYGYRTLVYGITKQDRHLVIVISNHNPKTPYVVTARDMSKQERREFHDQTKTN